MGSTIVTRNGKPQIRLESLDGKVRYKDFDPANPHDETETSPRAKKPAAKKAPRPEPEKVTEPKKTTAKAKAESSPKINEGELPQAGGSRYMLALINNGVTDEGAVEAQLGLYTPDGKLVVRVDTLSGPNGKGALPGLLNNTVEGQEERLGDFRDVATVFYPFMSNNAIEPGYGYKLGYQGPDGKGWVQRLYSPPGVERGLAKGQEHLEGAFCIHPDGYGPGTQGCPGVKPGHVKRYETAYNDIPVMQRPLGLIVLDHNKGSMDALMERVMAKKLDKWMPPVAHDVLAEAGAPAAQDVIAQSLQKPKLPPIPVLEVELDAKPGQIVLHSPLPDKGTELTLNSGFYRNNAFGDRMRKLMQNEEANKEDINDILASHRHGAVDIRALTPTRVGSPVAGEVTAVHNSTSGAGGRYVFIKCKGHEDAQVFLCHLSSIDVEVGQKLEVGDKIGMSGSSGKGSDSIVAPHLHMALKINGKAVDIVRNDNVLCKFTLKAASDDVALANGGKQGGDTLKAPPVKPREGVLVDVIPMQQPQQLAAALGSSIADGLMTPFSPLASGRKDDLQLTIASLVPQDIKQTLAQAIDGAQVPQPTTPIIVPAAPERSMQEIAADKAPANAVAFAPKLDGLPPMALPKVDFGTPAVELASVPQSKMTLPEGMEVPVQSQTLAFAPQPNLLDGLALPETKLTPALTDMAFVPSAKTLEKFAVAEEATKAIAKAMPKLTPAEKAPAPEQPQEETRPAAKASFWSKVRSAIPGLNKLIAGVSGKKSFGLGDRDNPIIDAAQQILIEGKFLDQTRADSDFGPKTKLAMEDFQEKFKKPVIIGDVQFKVEKDGRLGKITGHAMTAYAKADGNMDVAYNLLRESLANDPSVQMYAQAIPAEQKQQQVANTGSELGNLQAQVTPGMQQSNARKV